MECRGSGNKVALNFFCTNTRNRPGQVGATWVEAHAHATPLDSLGRDAPRGKGGGSPNELDADWTG